jgi:hypothetical protein
MTKAKKIPRAGRPKGAPNRTFPSGSFADALEFASSLYQFGSGQPVRRLSLFNHLGKSPEGSTSRLLVTNASKYGLIEGNYKSESLALTPDGIKSVADDAPPRERMRARIALAVQNTPLFDGLYTRYIGNKLPSREALVDVAKELGESSQFAEEAVDIFIVNVREVGLLKVLSGVDRLIPIDHALDELPSGSTSIVVQHALSTSAGVISTQSGPEYEKTCFYVSPIGEDGSEQRKHADLFYGSLVEPALAGLGLKVLRADQIDKPGIITRHIIDLLLNAKLVVADLSFHNPNVFYELALRHVTRKPTVQIIRKGERIPFDVNQSRTIQVDTTDIYSLVPQIEAYRAQIAAQARQALDSQDSGDNPVATYYPSLAITIQ